MARPSCFAVLRLIASFKSPRQVVLVEDYPMTSSGKVQRFALRERVLAGLSRR